MHRADVKAPDRRLTTKSGVSPFSRPFAVDRLQHAAEVTIDVEANAQERAALAKIDGIVAVDRLAGHFHVRASGAAGVRVVGEIEADIVQTCVVTLEPVPAAVREPVHMRFAPEAEAAAAEGAAARAAADTQLDLRDGDDPPDPIINGHIDLGVVAAEFLALGLDPYPRKPGSTFAAATIPMNAEEPGEASPFAALERLREPKS